jgi:methylisocitrate lyase
MADAALERARAYADAGASGLFVPGLVDEALIARITAASPLPVNVMAMPGAPDRQRLAALGVARISHGPGPYRGAMQWLTQAARAAMD